MSARLFIALVLGPELGRQAMGKVSAALAASRGLRSVRPDGLHLTLFFLGAVSTEDVEPLGDALAAGLAGATAPRLVVDRTGAFAGPGRERVLWLGVREEEGATGRLAALHGRTLDTLEGLGVPTRDARARPYRPHVTVARSRGRGAVAAAFHGVRLELPWRPAAVALVESVRRGAGAPFYETRREFALAADS